MPVHPGERREAYHYEFGTDVPLGDVQEALLLAVLAAESLHGRSRVHLDASFRLDEANRSCVVDAGTDVGRDIARVFTGFLTREFGERAFRVERTSTPPSPSSQETKKDPDTFGGTPVGGR